MDKYKKKRSNMEMSFLLICLQYEGWARARLRHQYQGKEQGKVNKRDDRSDIQLGLKYRK
jgi:hypothetical protein